MGAGVSIANNTAQAVAKAYESVINTTNVVTQQDNKATQDVTLNACDINAAGDVTITEGQILTQAMTQIASITSATSVTNDIAQALSQAAAAQVGMGVLGIASASNQASTYANMSTNVSNYVSLSAKQSSDQKQGFSCNNSTIVAGGNVTISLLSTDNASSYTNYNVDNATNIQDTISQTISQTATASTGFSIGGLVLILVLACIALLIYKLVGAKSTASHAQQIQEAVAAGCLDASHLDSKGTVMPALSPGSACAGLDVDKLLHPHKYVKPAFWVVYFLFILAAATTLGMWYLGVSQRGCLFNDACGANQDSQNFAGCSCNYDAAEDGTPLGTCDDPQLSSFTSTGMPLKYQFPVFYSDTSGSAYAPCSTSETSQQSAASMQGILVSALKVTSQTYNSNNGKNMDTMMSYVSLVGWPTSTNLNFQSMFPVLPTRSNPTVLNMFKAGVTYLANSDSSLSGSLGKLWQAIQAETSSMKGDNQVEEQAKLLALYLCPLRIVAVTNSTNTTLAVTPTWPNITPPQSSQPTPTCLDTTDNWVTTTDLTGNYLLNVPLAFSSTSSPKSLTSNDADPCYNPSKGAGNLCAGCCSAYMVKFVATSDRSSSSSYTNACGDADAPGATCFCNGFTSSKDCSKDQNAHGSNVDDYGQLKMQVPTSQTDTSTGPSVATMVSAQISGSVDANTYRPFYVEWADFGASADNDPGDMFVSFVRLLWAGVLAYAGRTPSNTVYGINALIANRAADHYYVANAPNATYGRVGDATSNPTDLANDTTLLTIKVLGNSGYSPRTGMPPMPCSGVGQPNAGQSYTASAPSMGYCRNWFYNKVARIIVIVLLVLCVLWLPFYYLARLYIDRNVGNMYLREALNASTTSSTSSSSTSSTSKQEESDVVMAEQVKQLKGGLLSGSKSRKTKRQSLLVRSKRPKRDRSGFAESYK